MLVPSILDVAKKAGVSAATVSHVINGTKKVSPSTRQKVDDAIRILDYKPNIAARNFKTGKMNVIAFIVPDIANPFFSTLIDEIETVLASKGYKLIILNTKETKSREKEIISTLSRGMADGLMIASTMEEYDEIRMLIPDGMPAIFIDRKLSGCPKCTICVDCYEATCQGIEDFIRHGHRRIGIITGLSRISTSKERLAAYENVMKSHGLYDPDLVKIGDSMTHCVKSHLTSLLDAGCTAIAITNNFMAVEAMMLMQQSGIKPGRDIEILGFKDSSIAQYGLQHMSLVCQPTAELGRLAGRQMLNLLEDPTLPSSTIILQGTYVPHDSSRDIF